MNAVALPGVRPGRTMQNTCNDHPCACRDTRRRLALLYAGVARGQPELRDAAVRFGWPQHPDLECLEIALGAGDRFADLAALADFLRGLLGEGYGQLRATWLDAGAALGADLGSLVRAPLLSTLLPAERTPIVALLDQRAISTWFQPVFERGSLAIWGYECLMRARDADGTTLSPARIIEWARQENLLFTLDRVCRERHIENAARCGAPAHAHFLINFLPTVIYDPTVCLRSTMAAAARHGISPERIVFEVVETEAVSDRQFLRRILDEYRAGGFRVALDDLGAGHSGLTLLADLEPDLIKIDRELIRRAPASTVHRTICKAVVDIARAEGKQVLAEGIETHAEWALANELGVDLLQGYLFGRPAPEPVTVATV